MKQTFINDYGKKFSIQFLGEEHEFDSFAEYKKDHVDVMFVFHNEGKVIKTIQVNNLGKNTQTINVL